MAFNIAFYCNVCKNETEEKGQTIEGSYSKEEEKKYREKGALARARSRPYAHTVQTYTQHTSTCIIIITNSLQRMNVKGNMPYVFFSPFVLPFRLFVYMMAFILNSSTIWTSLNWHNLGTWHVRVRVCLFICVRECKRRGKKV